MMVFQIVPTLFLYLLTAAAGIPVDSDARGSLAFVGDQHTSFADTYQYSTLEREFVVENQGTQPVAIIGGLAISGTGRVTYDPAIIPAGRTARIQVVQPVGDRLGTTGFRFNIVTDEPGRPKYRFSLSGFVQSPYDPETVRADLGFIDSREEASARFELHSREVEQLRLTDVTTEHPSVSIEVSPTGITDEGLELTVIAAPGLARGILYGVAGLSTNVTSQPRFEFSYSANVFGDVVPAENPVEFGLVRVGQESIKIIVVQSRSGTPFTIDNATNTIGEILEVSWKPCHGSTSVPSPCYEVRFSLSPEEERITGGIVDLHVEGDFNPVPINVTSWVVGPNTVVKQIGSTEAQAP